VLDDRRSGGDRLARSGWCLAGAAQEFGIEHSSTRLSDMHGHNDVVSTGDAWRAVIVMTIYTVVFVAASYVVFRRRDVTSG